MSTLYYQQREGMWWGSLWINGERRQLPLHADRETAEKLLVKKEHELLFGDPEVQPTALQPAIDQFMQHIRMQQLSEVRTGVIENALTRLRDLCTRFRLEYLQQISGSTAQAFVYERQQDTVQHKYLNKQKKNAPHKYEPTVSAWTVNNDIQILRRFFRYCIKMDLCDTNPFLKVDKLKEREKPEPYHFSDEDLENIWDVAEKFTDFYATMLYTGLRPTDAISLTVREIAGGKLNLRMNKTGTWLKNVPVPEKLMTQLAPRIEQQEDLLFPEVQSDRQQRNARKRIQALFPVWQVREQRITLHTFRHTYAHRLLQQGVSKEQVQTLLGHEHMETTEVYAQWVENGQLEPQVQGLDFGV